MFNDCSWPFKTSLLDRRPSLEAARHAQKESERHLRYLYKAPHGRSCLVLAPNSRVLLHLRPIGVVAAIYVALIILGCASNDRRTSNRFAQSISDHLFGICA
ncbi:hypothetical protein BV22DRAFT_857825 [Leucogyrophana mollusca]|uniref:Uncharacterized protein n=1 Tax=Leucogyrophana mollusca TaxID=85980 RepID=A0ACB8B2W2_9AGAM|nr:hypothetical protein BV22DRAFT_857825 [Leucogyrophana mollusca]